MLAHRVSWQAQKITRNWTPTNAYFGNNISGSVNHSLLCHAVNTRLCAFDFYGGCIPVSNSNGTQHGTSNALSKKSQDLFFLLLFIIFSRPFNLIMHFSVVKRSIYIFYVLRSRKASLMKNYCVVFDWHSESPTRLNPSGVALELITA